MHWLIYNTKYNKKNKQKVRRVRRSSFLDIFNAFLILMNIKNKHSINQPQDICDLRATYLTKISHLQQDIKNCSDALGSRIYGYVWCMVYVYGWLVNYLSNIRKNSFISFGGGDFIVRPSLISNFKYRVRSIH